MEHREHAWEHNCVHPLSPKVQARRVPCHRRFTFPSDSPASTKLPLDSTFALQDSCKYWAVTGTNFCRSYLPIRIICRKRGWRRNDPVYAPHRWASWLMPPRRFELISHYGRESENMRRNLSWKNTTIEGVFAGINFRNTSTSNCCFIFCECSTCLAAVIEIFVFWLLVAILELN